MVDIESLKLDIGIAAYKRKVAEREKAQEGKPIDLNEEFMWQLQNLHPLNRLVNEHRHAQQIFNAMISSGSYQESMKIAKAALAEINKGD